MPARQPDDHTPTEHAQWDKENHQFREGDPILVVGNPCRIKTCIGLFGFVEKIHETGEIHVHLLTDPHLEDDADIRAEKAGRFSSWSTTCQPADLWPLKDKFRAARVKRFMDSHTAEKAARKPDSKTNELMKDIDAWVAKWREDEVLVAEETKRIGQVFQMPGIIKRGDKSNYPAYRDPLMEKINDELRGYAARGPSKCTLEQRARWKQCLAATDASSFWSRHDEVRAAVKEFDLDPMVDHFNDALYCNRDKEFVQIGKLRELIIRLWNRNAMILYIQDAQDLHTCWSEDSGRGEQKGFLVDFALRRPLPES